MDLQRELNPWQAIIDAFDAVVRQPYRPVPTYVSRRTWDAWRPAKPWQTPGEGDVVAEPTGDAVLAMLDAYGFNVAPWQKGVISAVFGTDAGEEHNA